LEREKVRAFIALGRELEQSGKLVIGQRIRSGDYTRQVIMLEIP